MQNVPTEGSSDPGPRNDSASRPDTQSAKRDLTLAVTEVSEACVRRLSYNTDLFDAATIERMLRHYQCILDAALAHPDSRISELPVLTRKSGTGSLVEWNATDVGYPRELCCIELFERRQSGRRTRWRACSRAEQITYRELNERANQVARLLRRRGVGPVSVSGFLSSDRWR